MNEVAPRCKNVSVDVAKHLRYFLVVAEEEHIGRAAERLALAQPALSQRVKSLEAWLGTALIARSGRGIRLTPAGRRLAAEAAGVVATLDSLPARLNQVGSPRDHPVTVGLPGTLSASRLNGVATGLSEVLSPRRCVPASMSAEDRLLAARDDVIEAALVPVLSGGDLTIPLGIALAPHHPLAGNTGIHPSEFAEDGLMILDEDEMGLTVIGTELDRQGLPESHWSTGITPTTAAARALAGAACLTDRSHARDAGLVWSPVAGATPHRHYRLHLSRSIASARTELLEVIAEALEAPTPAMPAPARATGANVVARIRTLWSSVDIEGSFHVLDLSTGRSVGDAAELSWPIGSVAKVPLGVALMRAADADQVRPSDMVELRPDGRSRGTTGISAMSDSVTISLRDALYLAITISDNAAADALWDALGGARVAALLAQVVAPAEMQVREPLRELYDRIEFWQDSLDAPTASRATAQGLTHLLQLIWSDRAASPEACARLRELMSRQVWGHRLASGFPAYDISVAGKTGTVREFRHEIGVVTYPDQRRYAVAVLTQGRDPEGHHKWDWAIGETARLAIGALRQLAR